MKTFLPLNFFILLIILFTSFDANAQFPGRALVGYYETWKSDLKLRDIHSSYNVINMAFAVPTGGSKCNMNFSLPIAYSSTAELIKDIDTLHAHHKVVLISIGGENGEVVLENSNDQNIFVSSVQNIFAYYNYKIDGLDIDIEGQAVQGDVHSWTMSNPSDRQKFLIAAIKTIMSNYQTQTGKKMCLTMAPEVAYVQGGLSDYQVSNINGGWYLPLIQNLKDELDMLNCQLYNVYGNEFAIDGALHDEGTGNFIVAMTESAINGFTLRGSKGTYNGLPAQKVGFGTVGYNMCASYDYSSAVDTAEIILAVQYLRGKISKPAGWGYTCLSPHPKLKGMMVWSVNHDYNENGIGYCDIGAWVTAESFLAAFPAEEGLTLSNLPSILPLNIFPNPAENNVFINNSTTLVKDVFLYDNEGVFISSFKVNAGMNIFPINNLNSGIYWLKTDVGVQKMVVR